MASVAVRALLTQALELLAQEPTDVASEVVALQLRDLQTRYQKTLEDLRKAEDDIHIRQVTHPSVAYLEQQVGRLTNERDYYREAYRNLLNEQILSPDLK